MYPYNFRPSNKGINHREIFVVMPFDEKHDFVFNDLIVPSVDKANEILKLTDKNSLHPYRTKEEMTTTSGWINILEHLYPARIVIGLLTDNNPNVFYELRIAHATQPIERQILIAKQGYQRKFDTKDLIYFEYDKDISKSIAGLAEKIADSYKSYDIEQDYVIKKAKMAVGPYAFEVMMRFGNDTNFAMRAHERVEYDEKNGEGSFERSMQGITQLCAQGILMFNTDSKREGQVFTVYFSYWWTDLGNDVLLLLKIIDYEEYNKRQQLSP